MSIRCARYLPAIATVLMSAIVAARADDGPHRPGVPIAQPGRIAPDMAKPAPGSASAWKLARSKGAKDDEAYVTILRTADALKSDPDFVGLMVRCGPKDKIDVLLVVVTPLPPRSRPTVSITAGSSSLSFEGSPAAGGAAIKLPDESSALPAGAWQTSPPLAISIQEGTAEIKGVVDMAGFSAAYRTLLGACGG